MIVFNGFKLIGLAVMTALLIICVIINIIDRIIYTLKKHQQKRINDAFKEEGE